MTKGGGLFPSQAKPRKEGRKEGRKEERKKGRKEGRKEGVNEENRDFASNSKICNLFLNTDIFD